MIVKWRDMKRLFTLPLCGILFCFTFSSCDAPMGSIANPNTLDDLNRKSFEVTSYEMYNHDTQISFDLASTNDHVYLTFKDNELFITKENIEDGTVHFRFQEFTTDFQGGALQGIYLDEYNFMKTIHFSKTAKQVVLELEGVASDNDHFMSLFIVMDELESHPEGALQISGLPE